MDEHNDEHERQDDGPVPDGRTFRTWVNDELIETPATIAGIREALPAGRRAEFTKIIEGTPARDMPLVMLTWAKATRPEIEESIRQAHDRVEALAQEAETQLIMGEDPDVVADRFHTGVREGL
ncbi:hypothetical protein [Embleya scabrispora]|uniref:hypothetical protein n=1 Tax=Embleya scabrispora TaxID=159449 RepID=UPI00099E72AD|nr:hypothetical protein [Embleya scabrispora]MYS82162.1 hypothetical protein [Streptomyces sp. SID5474]